MPIKKSKVKCRYVLGFAFSQDLKQVLLIRKCRPLWQEGKLNGLGGKIESRESAVSAMVREFNEESGTLTRPHEWQLRLRMRNQYVDISVFATSLAPARLAKAAAFRGTAERPRLVSVQSLPHDCIDNLHWLIPFACDVTAVSAEVKITEK